MLVQEEAQSALHALLGSELRRLAEAAIHLYSGPSSALDGYVQRGVP